ncbi:hypothetical protein HDU77_009026 [Chytriomyces hyalinus]|nr:hypothetical protein HDU77_009026 [Chytriomyces hyalinus]
MSKRVFAIPRKPRLTVLAVCILIAVVILENPIECLEKPTDAAASSLSSHTKQPTNPPFPRIAVALKTGSETLYTRTATQLLTFLSNTSSIDLMLVGESPGYSIGGKEMVDVYTRVYEDAKARVQASSADKEWIQRMQFLDKHPSVVKHLKEVEQGDASEKEKGPIDSPENELVKQDDHLRKRSGLSRRAAAKIGLEKGFVVPGQKAKTKGWTLDAHKNLPAFRLLYNKFPNADWYIMIDDDSYIFLDNLRHFLSKRDPSENHYIGQGNRFRGCDGVRKMGDGPKFAQGGSGIVMSQGALKTMMNVIDVCIMRYKSCWAGDIRVGLCMRDSGILVEHFREFYGFPPDADFGFPDDPCTRPLVFHHSTQHQIQIFHDIERAKSKLADSQGQTLITMGDLYHHMNFKTAYAVSKGQTPAVYRMQSNTAVKGKLLEGDAVLMPPGSAPEACLSQCEGKEECVAWVLDEAGSCTLMAGPGKFIERNGSWSGVLVSRYKCGL